MTLAIPVTGRIKVVAQRIIVSPDFEMPDLQAMNETVRMASMAKRNEDAVG
jgi:hypothetical protein